MEEVATLEESLITARLGDSPVYFLVPVFGGAYLVNHLPVSLPEDEQKRDVLLSLTPYANGAWGNVLKSTISKAIAQGYTLNGDDDPVLQARVMLDRGGLSQFIVSHLRDYYCTNRGAWIWANRVEGRTVGYEYLDTLRIDRTDDGLLYCMDNGGYRELSPDEVFNIADPAGCVASQVYADIRLTDKTPDEMFFIEDITVQAVREASQEGSINHDGHLILPILPETPLPTGKALTKHTAIGRVNFGLNSWKATFTNVVNASILQGYVTFSFPTESKKNRVTGTTDTPAEPQQPQPIYITVNIPPLTVPQTVVNVPQQDSVQPNIVVNVPQQPAPIVNVATAEQPAPVVNIQPAQVNVEAPQVTVEAPQVNVAAPNVTVEVPQTEEEIIDVKRDAGGFITQATKRRKVKK